ncbi:MAG: YegS/Rv2252/BmrU family lipid kinase [Butyrivibrio sp.]|nr:YegS/Rv2252/BmrU family lipid kinase [Butyrivibrio sp.]
MFYCIVNPASKSGHSKEIYKLFESKCKEKGIRYQVIFTKGPGHAMHTVNRLTSKDVPDDKKPFNIIVMGGDGTLNEVISGIEDFENVRLGVIPLGSGNDFVRDLGFQKKTEDLIDTILKGEVVRRLDIGNVHYNNMTKTFSRLHDERISSDRKFDVSCGIGFDAAVCEEALSSGTKNFLNKIGLGKLTYGSIAVRQIINSIKTGCDIETDNGQRIHYDHLIFAAAMIHHYEGGGFNFAPDAVLDDGMFDLITGGDMSLFQIFTTLPLAFLGKHYGKKGIHHIRAKEIRIKTEIPLWVHTDGEVLLKSNDITLTCLKQKIALLS